MHISLKQNDDLIEGDVALISAITSRLWAKSDPYKSLIKHMIDAACCAQVLLTEGSASTCLPLIQKLTGLNQEESINLAAYLVALHDIGKCHPEFQKTATDLADVKALIEADIIKVSGAAIHFRHEIYTAEVLDRIWQDQGSLSEEYSSLFSTVLSMHHQGKSGRSTPILPSCRKHWHCMQEELEHEVRKVFCPVLPLVGQSKHVDAIATIIMGLVILSDWIASSEIFELPDEDPLDTYIPRAEKTAWKAIHVYGLAKGPFIPAPEDFCDLWSSIPRESVRPLQKKCETIAKCPATLYLIEAPMGEGKSEAALYLAAHMAEHFGKSGMYVALPSAATSNQMHKRVNELFSDHQISTTRLLHAMAWLVDDISMSKINQSEDHSAVSQWLAPLRRGLLSQSAVGTVDQAMMAVLQVKYSVLRLFGLSQKVLIIDEVHSYDAYMNQIVERLLSWCHALEIPVILLSATLPALKRKQLMEAYGAVGVESLSQEYPLISAVNANGLVDQIPFDSFIQRIYRFTKNRIMNEPAKIARLASDISAYGGCICILLNTVKMAQSVFQELQSISDSTTKLILFHSRFVAGQRLQIEEECVRLFGKNAINERPEKAILVCTQVVEQSLDVDFDTMITQVAPIDLLLQRAGRVHRHDKTKRPIRFEETVIHVLLPNGSDYQGTGKVYMPLLLDRTWSYLKSHESIVIPLQIREAIDTVYTAKVTDEEFEKYSIMAFNTQLMQSYAQGVILTEPHAEYFYAADCNPQNLYMQEDRETIYENSAKTRFGSDTMKISLVTQDMMDAFHRTPYDRKIVQKILMQSVTIRATGMGPIPPDACEGTGPLKGCLLLPVGENGAAIWNDWRILNSNEIGISIERV